MIPAAPRWFTHSSTALSAGHPCPPHRGFTQLAILRLLDATPVGQASRQTIRFQQDCDCVSNTQRMQEDLQAALMAQGILQRPESIERLPWAKLQQWMFGAANRRVELAKESRRLIELNARHGPLALVLHGAIPQGQGEGVYQNHHAVVLLATWCCGDRPLGLLLDGNDRQQNPAIEAIRAWQRASGDQRPLQELGPQDLEQINDALYEQLLHLQMLSLHLPGVRFGYDPRLDEVLFCSSTRVGKDTPASWLATLMTTMAAQAQDWRSGMLDGQMAKAAAELEEEMLAN